ncbi:24258_t:CDS:2 [Dentiscutata erythropus]|uniref:24258_t:CDS:1 n=1 Tax=Dentiscutata erythropus TaxID=1348616 RepID=A0A9N9E6A6_9GLOM|nr:24258_t:CDS:2 [Dentiscutata erythropus]
MQYEEFLMDLKSVRIVYQQLNQYEDPLANLSKVLDAKINNIHESLLEFNMKLETDPDNVFIIDSRANI